ncbi:hypothetical protein K431DRAFT_43825 [Polychaeton citri CBS 116435]|uniref:Secreted protein n=1 Tax=Polychaeton citri CBS 116435 TaxID=1314669 RepID=A0A9P4Q8S8_9PEZI|nr:hypothetical protein K431DRAFT_43825 [Polychaeton citri CBS 116435]
MQGSLQLCLWLWVSGTLRCLASPPCPLDNRRHHPEQTSIASPRVPPHASVTSSITPAALPPRTPFARVTRGGRRMWRDCETRSMYMHATVRAARAGRLDHARVLELAHSRRPLGETQRRIHDCWHPPVPLWPLAPHTHHCPGEVDCLGNGREREREGL